MLSLALQLEAHLRGVELSAAQLDKLGARPVEYQVQQLPAAEPQLFDYSPGDRGQKLGRIVFPHKRALTS